VWTKSTFPFLAAEPDARAPRLEVLKLLHEDISR